MTRSREDIIVRTMAAAAAGLVAVGGFVVWSRAGDGGAEAPTVASRAGDPPVAGSAPSEVQPPAAADVVTTTTPEPATGPADATPAAEEQPSPVPPLIPPSVGDYTYRINASDGERSTRGDATLSVAAGGGEEERRATLRFGGAATSRVDRWTPTSVVRVEQTDDEGQTCRWNSPLLVVQGPLVLNSTWNASATCDGASGRLEWTEQARVTATKSVRVGDDRVDVAVVERMTTRRSQRLTETTVTIDHFAPALGLSTTTAADIRSTTRNEAGEESTTTRRLVAELVHTRPRSPAS